jgi:hypothetical protein
MEDGSRLPTRTTTLALYRRLDYARKEIRLLTIRKGSVTNAIRCTLKTISLKEQPLPVYETISYAWGDATKWEELSVDRITLRVPSSTAAALRRFRYTSHERMISIDAICINQRDTEDRNH